MHRERIVIRGLNWLGDAIMCLPALQRLREARPDAHISILTPRKLADLWTCPLVDEVMPFDKEESLWRISRRLRAGGFSAGIVLPMSMRSAMELWLAGIPVRIGTEHRGRGVLLTHSVPKPAYEMRKRTVGEVRRLAALSSPPPPPPAPIVSHHIYRYLGLTAVLGADAAPVPPMLSMEDDEHRRIHLKLLEEAPDAGRPLFGMCPGGEYGAAKRWPEERFVEAAGLLHQKTGCRWLLFGAPAEAEACERIAGAVRAIPGGPDIRSLAGQTSLRELAGLLRSCALVLGNDSGPMHLAAAMGTPVAAPFGSTSAVLTGPGVPGAAGHFLLSSTAPCAPCFLRTCPIDMRCMNSLGVDHMVDGIIQLHTARSDKAAGPC